MSLKPFVLPLIAALLLAGCSKNVDSETVAYEFVRLYFVEDNVAEAARLASGSARASLEQFAHEIETMNASEPAVDKPLVKAELLDTQADSSDEIRYFYRISSDEEVGGMEPVTAKLLLSKEGNAWRVSEFSQEE